MKKFVGKQHDGKSHTSLLLNQLSCHFICSGASAVAEEMIRLGPKFAASFNSNADYGLPPPVPLPYSIVCSQRLLSYVKSGEKVKVRITSIDCATNQGMVRFDNGSEQFFDAIIFGTGYQIDLSMLDPETQSILRVPTESQCFGIPELDLDLETWYPQLPGVTFVGHYFY